MYTAADSLTAVTVSTENIRFEEITITKREKFTKFNRKQLAICYRVFFYFFIFVYRYNQKKFHFRR